MKLEIMFRIMNRIGLLLILIAVGFFIPGVLGASPNDACFADGCHNSTSLRPIDRNLYDSNPHSIIRCIDCHVNSTDNSSSDHGKFIRQLNGSKITGPLTTKYYSQNFSLCYACHNETKVVGVLPGYPNMAVYHLNSPVVVSSIGTNFINNLSAGFQMDGLKNYPANIHWDHLDAFRGGQLPPYTYATDNNNIDSYTSCPTCHNVHGTNNPMMTKNDLAIAYDSDSNGTYGYIGSNEYNNAGGDLYCNSCHFSGPQYRYYRNETKVFEDCISCHIDNVENITYISIVNKTAFEQGVHINISTTGGSGILNNNDCWTCHFDRDMNRSNINKCDNCHTGSGTLQAPGAPKIRSHLPDKINYSCMECHSEVIVDPGTGSVNITSHYLLRPTVATPDYCDYCHGPNAIAPFPAVNKTIAEFNHNDPNWDGNSTCRTCHMNSSVSADPLANDTSSFHDITTELGDAFNGTTKADCIICHALASPEFVDSPSPHDTTGLNIEDCRNCHTTGIGTEPQKIHNVTAFPGGWCILCHSNNATRYYVNTSLFARHANVNNTDGQNNISDDDCMTCHFGSANESMPMQLGAANDSNTYFCQDCHTATGRNPSQYASMTDETLRKMPMPPGHGENTCIQCHIPGFDKPRPLTDKLRYHTHGPAGFVD